MAGQADEKAGGTNESAWGNCFSVFVYSLYRKRLLVESGRLSDSICWVVFLADYGIVEYAEIVFWLACHRLSAIFDRTPKNHFLFFA